MFDLIGSIKKKTGLDELFGDGMSVPKSVQDVIKIDSVYADGIFMTGKDRYSKSYKFTDINYAVSSKEDKEANFLRYSEILNSLKNGISSQITIINRKLKTSELKEIALLDNAYDDKDKYRKEINDMLTMLANGANAIVQDKYVTLTIQKKTVEEARNHFNRVGADLIAHFSRLGSKCSELDLTERLRIIHDFCRPKEAADYHFDLRDTMQKGQSFKDYISPDGFEFKSDYFKMGDRFGRVLFIIVSFLLTFFPNSTSLLGFYQDLSYPGEQIITDQIIDAVKSKDIDALEEMMSPYAQENIEDLSGKLTELVNTMDGKIIKAGFDCGASDTVRKDYDSYVSYLTWSIEFKTDVTTYILYVTWVRADTVNSEIVGMKALSLFDSEHNLLAEVHTDYDITNDF